MHASFPLDHDLRIIWRRHLSRGDYGWGGWNFSWRWWYLSRWYFGWWNLSRGFSYRRCSTCAEPQRQGQYNPDGKGEFPPPIKRPESVSGYVHLPVHILLHTSRKKQYECGEFGKHPRICAIIHKTLLCNIAQRGINVIDNRHIPGSLFDLGSLSVS